MFPASSARGHGESADVPPVGTVRLAP